MLKYFHTEFYLSLAYTSSILFAVLKVEIFSYLGPIFLILTILLNTRNLILYYIVKDPFEIAKNYLLRSWPYWLYVMYTISYITALSIFVIPFGNLLICGVGINFVLVALEYIFFKTLKCASTPPIFIGVYIKHLDTFVSIFEPTRKSRTITNYNTTKLTQYFKNNDIPTGNSIKNFSKIMNKDPYFLPIATTIKTSNKPYIITNLLRG